MSASPYFLFPSERECRLYEEEPTKQNVYVVELSPSVLSGDTGLKKFLKANPHRDPQMPCLYVGQTGLTPEERLAKHLAGIKSGKGCHTFWPHLRPDLYEHLNPMTWDEAVKMENLLNSSSLKDMPSGNQNEGFK